MPKTKGLPSQRCELLLIAVAKEFADDYWAGSQDDPGYFECIATMQRVYIREYAKYLRRFKRLKKDDPRASQVRLSPRFWARLFRASSDLSEDLIEVESGMEVDYFLITLKRLFESPSVDVSTCFLPEILGLWRIPESIDHYLLRTSNERS